eukprot:4480715-Amphidinium_carterae.1
MKCVSRVLKGVSRPCRLSWKNSCCSRNAAMGRAALGMLLASLARGPCVRGLQGRGCFFSVFGTGTHRVCNRPACAQLILFGSRILLTHRKELSLDVLKSDVQTPALQVWLPACFSGARERSCKVSSSSCQASRKKVYTKCDQKFSQARPSGKRVLPGWKPNLSTSRLFLSCPFPSLKGWKSEPVKSGVDPLLAR